MRKIKQIHQGEFRPIADLITYSPMPTQKLQHLDPFLFLNHHGHQTYSKGNNGLPFGPHPHRGMETVTFILEGDISHKDSSGNESVIEAGGVQWMTAGKGLIHAEVSSDKFKKEGGELEILQLWINLPAKDKMTTPNYIGRQKDEINTFPFPTDEKVTIQQLAGEWDSQKGTFDTLNPISISTIFMKAGGEFEKEIPENENIFFYVVRGTVNVNGTEVEFRNLVEFEKEEGKLNVSASEDAVVILGHAKPFEEPIVAQGPFVMNSQQEIMQAYQDYQQGKFGQWVD